MVIIKQVSELLDTGLYETYTPDKTMIVADLLRELNLEDKFFGILVNGKKATPETKIGKEDEIIILPHIAGGF
ncbi:MAG: MoaD/ThiS family protein [Candidatus Lokiarchaeota archaeon]|nr:MoaD/ThiS family protein [Candidatus Lokiarchaeota archaeon]